MFRQRTVRFPMLLTVIVVGLVNGLTAQGQRPATRAPDRRVDCASLAGLHLQNVVITEALAVAAPETGVIKVGHCRVSGVIDKTIHFAELLPDRWNERLFAGGGGGFVGSVANQAQTSINFGYATVGTDTGHQGALTDASWALNNREALLNYAYLGMHRTAEVAKLVIKAYYGRDPRYSYFFGCSNGGRQGLMEAQRYPGDFNGVVSCAPALDFTNIAASFVRNTQVVFPNPKALRESAITPDNLKLLESKVLEACDSRDGVRDGILDDPRPCRFKVADLPLCSADRASVDCVTQAQRAAIERIYAPTTVGREVLYPGQPFGGEGQPAGWQAWITGVNTQLSTNTQGQSPSLQFAFGTDFFRYFVFDRKDWDYSTYDLSRWRADTRNAATILNADNPDLSALNAKGGKLILAHGWADPALNPLSTIAYYERIQARDSRHRDYVRLFMMPGVLHCVGGPGPDFVDWYSPIAEWVEHGRTPERVLAQKMSASGDIVNARPLCGYPMRAVYDGKGVTTDAASYTCKTP